MSEAISETEKQCTKCLQIKPLDEFHRRTGRVYGRRSRCKSCEHTYTVSEPRKKQHNKSNKKYRKTHKTAITVGRLLRVKTHKDHDTQKRRAWHYKTYFNTSLEELKKIVDYQNGRCAMCDRPIPKPHLDHSHIDGLIRGVLCWVCNRLLGFIHDDPAILQRGIDYLKNPPATRALGAPKYGLPGRGGTKKQRKLAKKIKKLQKHPFQLRTELVPQTQKSLDKNPPDLITSCV
jgi:hypothetical protein